jgi:hypothetical protein
MAKEQCLLEAIKTRALKKANIVSTATGSVPDRIFDIHCHRQILASAPDVRQKTVAKNAGAVNGILDATKR